MRITCVLHTLGFAHRPLNCTRESRPHGTMYRCARPFVLIKPKDFRPKTSLSFFYYISACTEFNSRMAWQFNFKIRTHTHVLINRSIFLRVCMHACTDALHMIAVRAYVRVCAPAASWLASMLAWRVVRRERLY